jgi:enamine deaminase RidA (YjgF/YER057c/UK114 family)
MSEIVAKFNALGVDLNSIPKPGGSYVAVNVRDNIAYVAIQLPIKNNEFYHLGRIGKDITTQQGYDAARLAATNVLAQVQKFLGLDKVVGLNHLDIHYQAGEDWDEGPAVANGASDLFLQVLGKKGEHTRTIIGVHKLPKNHSVALTASFTIEMLRGL